MHPFFKPVLNKGQLQHEQPKERPEKNSEQGAVRQGFERLCENAPTEPGGFKNIFDGLNQQNGSEDSDDDKYLKNLDIDPNVERRKRQKTTPFDSNETSDSPGRQTVSDGVADGDRSWLAQLQAATNPTEPQAGAIPAEPKAPPPTPPNGSPVKLAIRKSPTKTPRKPQLPVDTPVTTPPSTSSRTTRSSSTVGKHVPSPLSESTPKKVIKLTAKGKLLSSPPSLSPVSKRKIRSKNIKSAGKPTSAQRETICMKYATDDECRRRIGGQIDIILSRKPSAITQSITHEPPKATHPFFAGKPTNPAKLDVIVLDEEPVNGSLSGSETVDNLSLKPKDWKNLGFKKNHTSSVKFVDAILPLWPPRDMQHLGVAMLSKSNQNHQPSPIRQRSSKSRKELYNVSDDEDELRRYMLALQNHRGQLRDVFPLPKKIILTRKEMMNIVAENLSSKFSSSSTLQDAYPEAFQRMQFRILNDTSLIDIAAPGIVLSWLSKSAPTETSHILQPQSLILREWLTNHTVHHTATKLSAVPKGKKVRNKRRKKKAEELNDFIVGSDDEDGEGASTKNAILITGPSGCGKTASVYAAAKELGFEVFEIYPGMRRSAKDIFDKVGDMTQNHLVHKAAQIDRAREYTSDVALDSSSSESLQGSKNALQSFLGGKKQEKSGQSRSGTPQDELGRNQSRKQSLILFEEVDILFDEDRGFWTGVIQLIEQSKRPAVLTCNDSKSIPIGDLPLHATLEYEQVSVAVAVDYILLLAAAEGHWLERGAVHSLYLAREMDLRATISELDFWCQMAVGSEKAGLDWIIERRSSEAMKADDKLYSKNTYTTGMGLVPRTLLSPHCSNHGALLQYAQAELGIPLEHWHDEGDTYERNRPIGGHSTEPLTLEELQLCQTLAEARSVLDLLNKSTNSCSDVENLQNPMDAGPEARSDTERTQQATISAQLGASILAGWNSHAPKVTLTDITYAHLSEKTAMPHLTPSTLFATFEPLMVEKPLFPPTLGRLAPSLDTSSAALLSDIAPYARSIVRYDQRLQEQRHALAGGSQTTKFRNTRAARAALEGGNKATTREEKWFPKKTDYTAVLRTGGEWSSWLDESPRPSCTGSVDDTESIAESIAPSPAADVIMSDGA